MNNQRAAFAAVLTDRASFTTTLAAVLTDVYGDEWFEYDPETLLMEIHDDFGVAVPQEVFDRIMVAKLLHTTNDFVRNVNAFTHFCNILSGDIYDPDMWDPADSNDIAWGLTEAFILVPENLQALQAGEVFSEEIITYIGATLDAEGLLTPPDSVRLAVVEDDKLTEVQGQFSDDPDMFAAVMSVGTDKTTYANDLVKRGLVNLQLQLDKLPLKTGDVTKAVAGVLYELGRQDSQDSGSAGANGM